MLLSTDPAASVHRSEPGAICSAEASEEDRQSHTSELERIRDERDRLLLRLLDAEQVIAGTTPHHQLNSSRVAELEQELSAANDGLDRMRKSLSWRITAPLRLVMNSLRSQR